MTSTTTGKKGIVDFLWGMGWQNGDWGKLLIHKIVSEKIN